MTNSDSLENSSSSSILGSQSKAFSMHFLTNSSSYLNFLMCILSRSKVYSFTSVDSNMMQITCCRFQELNLRTIRPSCRFYRGVAGLQEAKGWYILTRGARFLPTFAREIASARLRSFTLSILSSPAKWLSSQDASLQSLEVLTEYLQTMRKKDYKSFCRKLILQCSPILLILSSIYLRVSSFWLVFQKWVKCRQPGCRLTRSSNFALVPAGYSFGKIKSAGGGGRVTIFFSGWYSSSLQILILG